MFCTRIVAETLPELFDRIERGGCRFVYVVQQEHGGECVAAVANPFGVSMDATGATIQEAIDRAFIKAISFAGRC